MSVRSGEIVRFFGDGDHVFRLGIGEWREIQNKLKVAPPVLYRRIATQEWMVDDCREVLRCGLIGGGKTSPLEAMQLIERYYDNRPFLEWVFVCVEIMNASLYLNEQESAAKKNESASDNQPAIPTLSSTSPSTTATVQ